jgi:hypothetical protein
LGFSRQAAAEKLSAFTVRDKAVFRRVLSDLMADRSFVATPKREANTKKRIVLDAHSLNGMNDPETNYLNFTTLTFAELRKSYHMITPALEKEFIARNNERVSLAGLGADLKDAMVIIDDLMSGGGEQLGRPFTLMRKYPTARAYVQMWMPGYSDDGRYSVVMFMWGPTAHGGTGIYLLERTKAEGEWTIILKRITAGM